MAAMPAVLTAILVFVISGLALTFIFLVVSLVTDLYRRWINRHQARRLLKADWWSRFEREFRAYASSSPRRHSHP